MTKGKEPVPKRRMTEAEANVKARWDSEGPSTGPERWDEKKKTWVPVSFNK